MSVYTCSCNLFYIEAVYRLQGKETYTQNCQWILPSFPQNVEYLPIADIDFTSVSTKKQNLDTAIDNLDKISVPQKQVCVKSKILPSYKEMEYFYECLGKSNSKPAILSLIKPHSDKYVPSSSLPEVYTTSINSTTPAYETSSYTELLEFVKQLRLALLRVKR